MPRLMRGIARTAAIAGTATAVSNRVSRRQANRWSAEAEPQPQPQYYEPAPVQYAPPPTPAGPADPIAQLTQLAELRNQGVLTDAEFQAQKAKILAS